jgi:hypothetical protein
MARQMPSKAELLDSARHVVYEYANLISCGELLTVQHAYPINTHLQDAFLLSCRKIAEFFITGVPTKHNIAASDFTVSRQAYRLPVWRNVWGNAIQRQLAHIAWKRDQGWDGSANKPLMDELEAAWQLFLGKLKPEFQDRFREEINKKRQCSGFEHLDLG